MPDNPTIWIVALTLLGLVVLLALIFGRGFIAKLTGVHIEVKEPRRQQRIKVLENAELDNVKGGNIVGRRTEGDAKLADAGDLVDVASGSKIKSTTLGDITGVEHKSSAGTKKKTDDTIS